MKNLVGSTKECQNECDYTPGCNGFFYDNNGKRCYLKNIDKNTAAPRYKTNCTCPTSIGAYYQKLLDWYNSLKVEQYQNGQFRKSFKKGSPLEWYNPVWTFDGVDPFGHGLSEDWVDMENLPILQSKYYFV
jgi:hypothetical protein